MKQVLPISGKGKFRLVKWEAEAVPEVTDPKQDPRCKEIIEWEVGGPKKVIYKKEG